MALEAAAAPAAECAFHALAALLDEPAFRYSVAAGNEAFASCATQEALGHFDAAREVAHRMQTMGEGVDEGVVKDDLVCELEGKEKARTRTWSRRGRVCEE